MILECGFAVCLLDLVGGGFSFEAQDLVRVNHGWFIIERLFRVRHDRLQSRKGSVQVVDEVSCSGRLMSNCWCAAVLGELTPETRFNRARLWEFEL